MTDDRLSKTLPKLRTDKILIKDLIRFLLRVLASYFVKMILGRYMIEGTQVAIKILYGIYTEYSCDKTNLKWFE